MNVRIGVSVFKDKVPKTMIGVSISGEIRPKLGWHCQYHRGEDRHKTFKMRQSISPQGKTATAILKGKRSGVRFLKE